MKNALLGTTALLLALASAAPSLAQQKTITVGAYGGSFEQTMRKEIIPAFEAKHGVKVEYVAGNSTDTLAKLQAQKGNQQIDAIIVDDGPAYQATVNKVISMLQIPRIQPGLVVDVRYDRANPSRLALVGL